MKYLSLILLLFVLSCAANPEKELLKRADKFIQDEFIPTLKDPSSYQKAEVTLDTLLYKDAVTSGIAADEELLASMLDSKNSISNLLSMSPDDEFYLEMNVENEKDILATQASLDSLKSLPIATGGSKITSIFIKYSYRAKNGMGALDLGEIELVYDVDKDSFRIR